MTSTAVLPPEPGALTSFVGRAGELRSAAEAVADSRLVTVVGPGGVGKTRFARQLMLAVAGDFEEAPTFVDLTPVHSGERVGATILLALGGQPRHGSEVEAAAALIGERRLPVVVDNCEQVIAGAADAAQRLLLGCPELHLVATSREPLGVPGEALYRLLPLPVPAAGEITAASPSVELFMDRARAAQRGFTATNEAAAAVASICRAVDGIPLAIELAAARVRTLPVEQLASRMTAGLGILAGGPRTAPERHRTMHATIAWSVDTLQPAERALFRRLAVFTGGWTLEAAEGICAGGEVRRDAVLDLLEGLVDRSLVVSAAEGGRFRLLQPILEHAREGLLDSGEADDIGAAHCRWFAQLALTAEPQINTGSQVYWLDTLGADHDNFRSALSWATMHAEQLDAGLLMAGALVFFWNHAGLAAEGYRLTGRLLAAPFSSSPRARMAALVAHSWGASYVGDSAAAERAAMEAYDCARELNDPLWMSRAKIGWGYAIGDMPNYEEGAPHFEEALALAETTGAKFEIVHALMGLAFLRPDSSEVRDQLERAHALARELGDPTGQALTKMMLAEQLRLRGDLPAAELAYQESREHALRAGNPRIVCVVNVNRGFCHLQRGEPKLALSFVREGLEMGLRIGDTRIYQGAILGAACADAITGDAARAAKWLACADAGEPFRIQPPDYPIRDMAYEHARRRLGERFDTEFQRGVGRDLVTVAREVLAALTANAGPPAPVEAPHGVHLSARETEILRLVAAGTSNRDIAAQLVLSTRTVENHVANVYAKIGAQNRVEATRWAVDAGVAGH